MNINAPIPTNLSRAETAPISNGPQTRKDSFSIVYSSVSGTGKTVSMLQLKEKLPKESKDASPIVVSYLGFNSGLELNTDERWHIMQRKAIGAKEVLARRLVASTIISHQNPRVKWSSLPTAEAVYSSFSISYLIPTVKESQKLLYEYMDKKNLNSISIVAGVDEVQLLNNEQEKVGEIGLGRFFLRTLRKWQVDWKGNDGAKRDIYLLPLGTGIAVDWCNDSTTGRNTRIKGSDATLISKSDFKELTKQIVQKLKDENQFGARFENATEETVVENVSAMYWPRVRLLQWLGNNEIDNISDGARSDDNSIQWNKWLSKWMLDEPVDLATEKKLAPGGKSTGGINALFELLQDQKVNIVPDGFAATSILSSLGKVPSLTMSSVYKRLERRFQSLDPSSLVVGDEYAFEEMGFDVVTLAIHVGLYAILQERQTHLSFPHASEKQKLRLGLALWFVDHGALREIGLNNELPPPIVLGQGSISETTNFYPFKNRNQNELLEDVKEWFRKSKEQTKQPLYIRCGKNACCDYLYFFRTTTRQGKVEWICTICDAKHTNTEKNNIPGDDQKSLYDAAIKVKDAISNMNYILKDIRLVFVTNKMGKADSVIEGLDESKRKVQTFWPNNAELELLNKDTFDCGPFSDVLMARRHQRSIKRKRATKSAQRGGGDGTELHRIGG